MTDSPRTYEVRTYGCQMNVHDSERLSGLLEDAGYVRPDEGAQPDVVVFNTCAVRENADNRLYGNLGHLKPIKDGHPGMQIAVGGCMAQKDRGCNNTCTFCIVPSLRGKEKDRRPGDVLAEVEALVAQGVIEVTLLGQNVNAYGVEFGDRSAFASLLRACGPIEGLERVRFTSPHPADFTDDVIAAMAETPNVMPQLHMPLQSGSDRLLKEMRRSYRSERYLGIIDRVRAAMPDAAITTDIIVGFPGETDDDFAATLDVVRQARFASAFTFQYSPRPGTPAATYADQVPPEVVRERYLALQELSDQIAWDENKALVGRTVELLVAEGEGRKDGATLRLSGRAPDNRLVHFVPGEHAPRPGDVVNAEITYAAPHHLVSDMPVAGVRRTRAGDAWESRAHGDDDEAHDHGHGGGGEGPVLLGLPSVRT